MPRGPLLKFHEAPYAPNRAALPFLRLTLPSWLKCAKNVTDWKL